MNKSNNSLSEQKKIGYFIKKLREKRGLTQKVFAKALKTSQSAVARMEKGGQNFSTRELMHISEILEHKIITLSSNELLDFQITGGHKLHGQITTNCSKNGAMGLLCVALLNRGKTILRGIPRIEEVKRLIEVLESIGVSIRWLENNTLEIIPPAKLKLGNLNRAAAVRTRSVLMLIGALAHREKKFTIPNAGGCKMGERPITAHRHALRALGISVKTLNGEYLVNSAQMRAGEVVMYESSDTATENALIAAALIPGQSLIEFASFNYQVQEICFFLEKLGVKIDGVGTSTLIVHGIKEINKTVEYWNSEDPIESMMWISAAVTTGSRLKIKRCPIDFLKLELLKLQTMGLKIKQSEIYKSKNGRTNLADIEVFLSKLRAPRDKIHAQPYPGINSDNLPFFVPIATQAEGTTLIHDWMWENRAIYFTEINRLGANVSLADPHRAFIQGPTPLTASQVVCPPALRPAVVILIAMLAARGTSVLRNIYSISRGYEDIAQRLNKIGADIKILKGL